MALLRPGSDTRECLLIGVERKLSPPSRNGAIDPKRSWRNRLLDHFVGAGEDRRRDEKTERLGGLQVDHQFECGGLLGW
jgi:hypothetical protein